MRRWPSPSGCARCTRRTSFCSTARLADLLSLVVAAHHLHLVVLADRHRAHAILLTKVLGEGRRHEAPPDVRGRREVALPLLASRRRDGLVQLHVPGICLRAGKSKATCRVSAGKKSPM